MCEIKGGVSSRLFVFHSVWLQTAVIFSADLQKNIWKAELVNDYGDKELGLTLSATNLQDGVTLTTRPHLHRL